jgi:predicted PurR-regulated permease PerM
VSARPYASFALQGVILVSMVALALALWTVRDGPSRFFGITAGNRGTRIADVLMARTFLSRRIALALAAALLVSAVTAIVWTFGAQIVGELTGVCEQLPQAWERTRETLDQSPAGGRVAEEIEAAFAHGRSLRSFLSDAGGDAMPLASGLTSALRVLFIAGFLTTSGASFRRGVLLLIPKGTDERVAEAFNASARALRK